MPSGSCAETRLRGGRARAVRIGGVGVGGERRPEPQQQRRAEQLGGHAAHRRRVRRRRGEDELQRAAVLRRLEELERVVEVRDAQCLIDLVDDDVADALQLQLLPLECQLAHPPRRPHDQLRPRLLDALELPVGVAPPTAAERGGARGALGDALDLEGELARRRAQRLRPRLVASS